MNESRWNHLEELTARVLGGCRVTRRWDLFESAPDVVVFEHKLVIDCKAHRRFTHHTLMEELQRKYCNAQDVPVLVTQHEGQQGAYAVVPLEFLAQLLARLRIAEASLADPAFDYSTQETCGSSRSCSVEIGCNLIEGEKNV